MRQFFAILRDSFREAVDGFVIYAMLGMSGLLILVAASLSFTPVAPDKAFDTIVKQFNLVVPEKGGSRAMSFGGGTTFRASDIQPSGGGYTLRLTVTGQSSSSINNKPDPTKGDSFRRTVVGWANRPGATTQVNVGGKDGRQGGRRVEIGQMRDATAEEQVALTDAELEEFIRSQFLMQAGMDATVTRVRSAAEEPVYVFDVTTTGGSSVRGWPHTTKLFFGAVTLDDETPLGGMLWVIEDVIINRFGGTFAILVGLIITSFFIPNMLRKGSVDLFISKPISRSRLLIYKYVGGLTFMLVVTTFTVGGIWLVLAVRSGYWNPAFLATIPLLTFTFAIFYAVSTLAAVFTRSAVAAMLLSVGFAFFLFVFGQIKANYDERRALRPNEERGSWGAVVETAGEVLPRTRDLDLMIRRAVSDGTLPRAAQILAVDSSADPPSAASTFGVSLAHIAWMVGLSCWWFSRRDY